MSKTIVIKKIYIVHLLISLIIGFGILFGLEHNGKFSYLLENNYSNQNSNKMDFYSFAPPDAKASTIYYETYFGKNVITYNNDFLAKDFGYEGEFHAYKNKLYYIVESVKLDFMYGIAFSMSIFLLFLFFSVFKIKFI